MSLKKYMNSMPLTTPNSVQPCDWLELKEKLLSYNILPHSGS